MPCVAISHMTSCAVKEPHSSSTLSGKFSKLACPLQQSVKRTAAGKHLCPLLYTSTVLQPCSHPKQLHLSCRAHTTVASTVLQQGLTGEGLATQTASHICR